MEEVLKPLVSGVLNSNWKWRCT